MNDQPLGSLDVGAIAASGLLIVGSFFPFWVLDFDFGFSTTANFLDLDGGFLAVLAGGAAIAFTTKRKSVGAIACLAGAGLLVLWNLQDVVTTEYVSLGLGVYVMLAGIVGGIVCHAIALAAPDRGVPAPQAWTPPPPPVTPPPPPKGFHASTGRPTVDPDDPFRIVQ